MRVDHRRRDVLVPEELLDGSDVVSVLQQMGGERMPERVAGRSLGQRRRRNGLFHRALQDHLVQMVPTALPGLAIDVGPRGWEYPLPRQLTPRSGVLPERVG